MDEDDGEIVVASRSISSDNKTATTPSLCNIVYDRILVGATDTVVDHSQRLNISIV